MESKQQLVDSILETVREELASFVEEESGITSSLEYEQRLIDLSRHFARVTLKKTQGELPKSRNSKKRF